MAKYKRSFSSGAKKISTANEVVSFKRPDDVFVYNNSMEYNAVEYLEFETYDTPCKIKLNDEQTVHYIDVNSSIVFSDILITQITIVDAGVEYYYTAFATN
jgi:hypothetical protein